MQNQAIPEEHVSVFCRVKAPADAEPHHPSVQVAGSREVTVYEKHHRSFMFNRAFGPENRLDEIFDAAVLPFVKECMKGYSCALFTYGQSKSGKTALLFGKGNMDGLVPRFATALHAAMKSTTKEAQASISCMQIYNEELRDFVRGDKRCMKKLRMIDDTTRKGTVNVQGLDEYMLRENVAPFMSDLEKAMDEAGDEELKRSSLIVTFTVHVITLKPEGEEVVTGKMTFVLAPGSELAKMAGASKTREAATLAQSLSSLNRVIAMTSEGGKHLPYRESKLTRVMQDALGGRTKTSFLFTVSSLPHDLAESINTLEIAMKAKSIVSHPELCTSFEKQALIRRYNEEIKCLTEDLRQVMDRDGIYVAHDNYERVANEITENDEKMHQIQAELQNLMDMMSFLRESTLESYERKLLLKARGREAQDYLVKTTDYVEKANSKMKKAVADFELARGSVSALASDLNKAHDTMDHDRSLVDSHALGKQKLREVFDAEVDNMRLKVQQHKVACELVWKKLEAVEALAKYPDVVRRRVERIVKSHQVLLKCQLEIEANLKLASKELKAWLETEQKEDNKRTELFLENLNRINDYHKVQFNEALRYTTEAVVQNAKFCDDFLGRIEEARRCATESHQLTAEMVADLSKIATEEYERHMRAFDEMMARDAELERLAEEMENGPEAKIEEAFAELEVMMRRQEECFEVIDQSWQIMTHFPIDDMKNNVEEVGLKVVALDKQRQVNIAEAMKILKAAKAKEDVVHEKAVRVLGEIVVDAEREAEAGKLKLGKFEAPRGERLRNVREKIAPFAEKYEETAQVMMEAAETVVVKDAEDKEKAMAEVREGLRVLNQQVDAAVETTKFAISDSKALCVNLANKAFNAYENFTIPLQTGNTPLRREYKLPTGFPDLTPKRF